MESSSPPDPSGTGGERRMPAVNDVGEPGAGEPHARFDGGPLAKRRPADETAKVSDGSPTDPYTSAGADQPVAYPTSRLWVDGRRVGSSTVDFRTRSERGQFRGVASRTPG